MTRQRIAGWVALIAMLGMGVLIGRMSDRERAEYASFASFGLCK